MCHLNLCIKKWGSPSSFRRQGPVISLNCSAFIENLSISEGARARARSNHAKNDAQKGCAMQLKGLNQFILYTLLGTVLLTVSGLLSRSLFIMQTMNKRPCARVWPKYAIICLICHLSSQQTELNQGNAR